MTKLILIILSFTALRVFSAEPPPLTVADIFSDHMVLQAGRPVPVWGTASPGQTVTVRFARQEVKGKANEAGQWRVDLPALPASAMPRELRIQAETAMVFEDVLVGEVWHASGQSNMGWTMKNSAKSLEAMKVILEQAGLPQIRYRKVHVKENLSPQSRIGDDKSWTVCSPETAANYSAVAFLFARRLHEELEVPIGIIETAWGGHPIEPFIPREAFTGPPVLEQLRDLSDQKDLEGLKEMTGGVFARNESWLCGTIYNSRIAPIVPYAIRGAIWYQAESNCGKEEDPRFYSEKMKALIRGWRSAWDQPKMPVYYVQLPQYDSPGWVSMRDEQRRALEEPHTGMAVTIDLALDQIHPANKLDVAERLARFPLKNEYGKKIIASGPLVKDIVPTSLAIVVTFDSVSKGLSPGSKTDLEETQLHDGIWLNGFEVLNSEGEWLPAMARIGYGRKKDAIVCSHNDISVPRGVRYGWAPVMPEDKPWNLYNSAGLPASPFISSPELITYDPHAESK